ncbi:MAG TPA: Crp/Fnr family transcriptional regulator [Caulobacteraceae bacterium]|nr:Crp/Fnr family transcriptional regulator [Caulobacteraceae bacterium]
MTNQAIGQPPRGNTLLRALAREDMDAIRPSLEHVALVKDHPIFLPGEPASHVWFPIVGMISVVALDDRGAAIEVVTVGHEGMTGLSIVLGSDTMIYSSMVQVPGDGWRIESATFRRLLERHPTIRLVMLRYVLAAMTQMGQNAACGHLHHVEARCARWLLLAHDDVDGDTFPLTQDYMAMMLGVTRPSVSAAASSLQKAGLIRYSRGVMTILDRSSLEAASCECYGIVRREFERLLRDAPADRA